MMALVKLSTVKTLGKSLIDDGENIEYTRGVCELIADLDGVEDVGHAERTLQIAEELGVTEENRNKFYDY